jgi:hypothetical protein
VILPGVWKISLVPRSSLRIPDLQSPTPYSKQIPYQTEGAMLICIVIHIKRAKSGVEAQRRPALATFLKTMILRLT